MIEHSFTIFFSLFSLFFIIILGLIVIRNGRQLINRLFTLLNLILIIWIFGSLMLLTAQNEVQIIFWDLFIYAGIIFWAAIQYHFSLAVTHFNFKRKIALSIAYLLSFFFLIISRTDFFASGVFYYRYGSHTQAKLGHHLFMIFFAIYVALFFYILLKKYYQEKNKIERSKTFYYILGFSVLNFIGGTAFLPAYSIPIYPIFLASPLIFSLIITYSIVYLGLMNIKLIMRRYSVYLLSFVSLFIPAYLILYYIYLFYFQYFFPIFIAIYVSSLISFDPLKKKYYYLANKYFFSSLYDTKNLIYKLNNDLRSSLEIKKIFHSVTKVLTPAFHFKSIAIIKFNERQKEWSLLYNDSFPKLDLKIKHINNNDINKIFSNNQPVNSKTIQENSEVTSMFKKHLKSLRIELLIPIRINKDKLNYLILFGPKESGDPYHKKDLQILKIVANEIGIAIENALLYQSVKRFNIKLQKEVSRATTKLEIQNKTLVKLDEVKDEFISIVSHQLRTPLTGIRWFTEILIKNKDKNLNHKQIEMLQHIGASNMSLIKLVNDLLDVSHIETGHKFIINKNNFLVNELINEVLKENIYLIKKKKLMIDNKIKKDLVIYADRDKIKQVWQNLISNATKYTDDQKTIQIYSRVNNKNQIVFYLKDEGVGIPQKEQAKLFNKFFRANNASLKHAEGTGLGLHIARELIRAHQGEMFFKSKENRGSSFYFSLPIIKK
ncbi:MAG: hypothetical protein EOM88_03315 [Clostridia bacterium]|nr:hypothetical protein [Clostridia bacterium]